jgi:hypothetical protein
VILLPCDEVCGKAGSFQVVFDSKEAAAPMVAVCTVYWPQPVKLDLTIPDVREIIFNARLSPEVREPDAELSSDRY